MGPASDASAGRGADHRPAAGGVERVAVTEAATALLRTLERQHGPLMFHQSGGCCDGSSPMCYPDGDFLTGDADVHLGDLRFPADDAAPDGPQRCVPVWMGRAQFEYWKHTHLTIDVVPGRGAGFSLEAPEGVRFLIRSRLFTDAESEALLAAERAAGEQAPRSRAGHSRAPALPQRPHR